MAEIAAIKAIEHDIELRGAYDKTSKAGAFLGKSLWRELPDSPHADGYVFTGLDDSENGVRTLAAVVGADKVFVPDIVAVTIDWSDSTDSQPGASASGA